MPAAESPNLNENAGGMLALVTEAFGGRGGIAQYNRDFLSSIAVGSAELPIVVMPRLVACDDTGELPGNIFQRPASGGKVAYSLAVMKAARRLKPKTLFCGHLYMAPLAMLAARVARAKLIIQLHGIEIWREPKPSQRRALEAADLVLCVSRDTRKRVLAMAAIAPHKVRVLPNTVAAEFTPGDRALARSEFGLATDLFVLLSVGRLNPAERYKGQDQVIAALPRLRKVQPSVRYVVAGEGEDRPRLEAMATERGVADLVTFLGQVAPGRLADLYRAADLFVLPSTGEGFGIVYLEAMASGTPAIGLSVAGARDALVDGELGSAPSPEAFEDTLVCAAMGAPMYGDTLAAAVHEHFGWPTFCGRALALLKDDFNR